MKRLTWWALSLAAAAVLGLAIANTAQAGRKEGDTGQKEIKAHKAGKKSSGLRGEYAILASECNLTAEQEASLKAKVEARNQAMAEWQQAHGEKALDIRKAMKAAKDAGNKEEMKRLGEEMKALSTERRQMEEKTMAAIYAILTPEQNTTWAGFRLYRQAMGWCKRAGLSEEQQATIRKMADARAKELADASDEKAQRQINIALREEIEQSVLTAEQREALAKKPTKTKPEKHAGGAEKSK